MVKNEKGKNILLAVLLVAVLTLSVAYAALSATLNINAQAIVKSKSSWNIQFVETAVSPAKTCVASGYASVTTQPTINSTSFTGLAVNLVAPGDKVTCTWNVENNGDIDAYLKTFTKGTPTCTTSTDCTLVKNNVTYNLTYSNGTAISAGTSSTGDALNSKADKGLKLEIIFKQGATQLPTSDVTLTGFDTTFIYEQK